MEWPSLRFGQLGLPLEFHCPLFCLWVQAKTALLEGILCSNTKGLGWGIPSEPSRN